MFTPCAPSPLAPSGRILAPRTRLRTMQRATLFAFFAAIPPQPLVASALNLARQVCVYPRDTFRISNPTPAPAATYRRATPCAGTCQNRATCRARPSALKGPADTVVHSHRE
jgi:hypothetical protein